MKLNKIKNMCRTLSAIALLGSTLYLVYIRRYQPEPVAPDERRRKDGRSYLRGLPA